ncbi:unnamed protein product, partial [Rotaria sp. Silwood2]
LFDDTDQSSINLYDKIAICYVRCSIENICFSSRYPNQTLYVLLYTFLIMIGLVLFSIATTLSTTITFVALDNPNIFGKQRAWGTLGSGTSAFIVSRLYLYFKKEYIYILAFIMSTIICIISTSLIKLRSDNFKQSKRIISDKSRRKEFKDFSPDNNQYEDNTTKNNLSKIHLLIPLCKQFDVIVFLLTTFIWGISFGVMDPVKIYRFTDLLNENISLNLNFFHF